MIARKFTVAASEGATEHSVSVNVPTFAEATTAQRTRMYEEGLRSVVIKVQGTLRRRLAKGVRGEALSREAQVAFDAILNGTTAVAVTTVDAAPLFASFDLTNEAMYNLARGQVDALTASGAVVINIPAALAKPFVAPENDDK